MVNQIPKEMGVYCLKNKKEILYIGKGADLRERIKNHFQQPTHKDYFFLDKVKKIGYMKTNSEIEALILEANLIKKYQPKYNVIWKDDKNYFFVGMTKEDFPRIFLTHQRKKLDVESVKLEVEYAGPFVDGKALKQTLKVLRKVFPYRSCKKIPNRPCLWYYLGYCPAPCLLKSRFIKETSPDSLKIKKISQRDAEIIMKMLKKGKVPVLRELKKEMKMRAKKQKFEEAARIRDQIESLEKIISHSKIFQEIHFFQFMPCYKLEEWKKTENELKKILKLQKVSRIEAYDVSQIHGNFAVGSMVAFSKGIPEKNFYRRFKIKFTKIPSDVDMIKEILKRRFRHKEWKFPDLILIDGGKAQLNAAINCKLKSAGSKFIKTVALAKRKNKLFLEDKKEPIFLKNLPREIFKLILRIRDEAHRFAISYHKKLREKELLKK